MRKYLILVIVTVNIFWISCAPLREQGNIVTEYPPPPDGHPAIVILAEYRDTNKPDNRVVPYFVSLMALDLLKRSPSDYLGYIKPYLNWYLDHLNYPDKYGLTGSIYDYRIYDDGREEPLEDMDSVDSYAALFIMLVNRYFDLTGDWQFIESNRQKLEDIAYLMPYLQRDDGLTVALPETTVKYLMDNCEVLEGVSAFVALTSKRGWDIQSYYREVQSDLIQAIGNLFYNPQSQNYYWAIDGDKKSLSGWETFYPDGLAQLFPILYGILQDRAGKELLWNKFHEAHGDLIPNLPVAQKIIYQWTKEVMENEN